MLLREDKNGLLAQLGEAATALDGAFAPRARSFVDVGEGLVEAVSVFHELTAIFDALPNALANDDLRESTETLQQVAKECTAIHDIVPDQVRAMEALAAANVTIGKRLELLRTNIQTIANIAINARIEASALKSNSQEMLTFTYEVAKLASTAEATINQYGMEQRKAHEALHAARAVLLSFETKHRAQLGSIARELDNSLGSVEARRTDALGQSTHIGQRSRQIAQSIGKIITALQIADITSQRLAHVHEAVEQLSCGIAAEGGDDDDWWTGLDHDERTAVAAEVATLQLAQIENALADLNSETRSIESEISQLRRDAAEMTDQGSALYGSDGASAKSFLGELAARINVAGHLLHDCQIACRQVDELNESVGARFGALHAQAASLEGIVGVVGGVRLIGLNAHLKSDGLGPEGRTLSAISRELRNSAEFISAHARDLIKAIDETISLFDELKKHNAALGVDRIATLDIGMSTALSAFEESGGSLATALATLRSQGERVKTTLHAAQTCLHQGDKLEHRLENASRVLEALAHGPGRNLQTSLTNERAKIHFAQRYTMAAERNVHGAGASAGASTSALSDPGASAELEDIFF
jgi:chromosome segregation ATPase